MEESEPEYWEYVWVKRSNGHLATAPTREPLPLSLFGIQRQGRYKQMKRPVYAGEWEDA